VVANVGEFNGLMMKADRRFKNDDSVHPISSVVLGDEDVHLRRKKYTL